jgi:diguanylate cyclase (GGDEF)-like protein
VNDQEVSSQSLRHGDYVRLGRVTFRFLAGENAERDYYEEVHQLAVSEPRTHLANYRRLREVLDVELARMSARDGALSLLLVSIDQLSSVFDEHGPVAVDHLIREVAQRLRPFARPEGLLAAPYPTGEFALMLPGTAPPQAAETAEQLRAAVASAPVVWGALTFKLTASIGIAGAELGMADANALLQAALAPTQESIAAGGNRVTAHEPARIARAVP